MALVLAALHPDRFAAVGVHSGLPYGLAHDQVTALMLMHQGRSALVGEAGALVGVSVPAIVFQGEADLLVNPINASWIIQQVLMGGDAPRSEYETGRTPDGLGYTRTRYLDRAGAIRAELWMVQGGGHGWFGGDPAGSFAEPKGPDASPAMLRFFLSLASAA